MNTAELIVKYLEDIGVKHVFYIPGGASIPFTQAIGNSSQIDFVCTSHESGAAFMAHGYAWMSGILGVCCFTTGPGAMNALNGVAAAKMEHTPLLVLTAMNPMKNFSRRNFQDSTPYEGIDTVAIYDKVTHYSRTIYHPGEAYLVMQNAIRIALSKQGPVHVALPVDVGREAVPKNSPVHQPYQYISTEFKVPDKRRVTQAIEKLVQSQRPLLFVGHGAVVSGAFREIKKLAESLSIPVMTTLKAKGVFPENHLLSLGVYGFATSGHASTYMAQHKHDLLLTIGVGFHEFDIENWTEDLMPSETFIQMDIDPLSYGCYYPADIGLIGDARKTVNLMNQLIAEYPLPQEEIAKRREEIVRFKNETVRFNEPEKMNSQSLPIKPQRLMKDIEESFPEETVFVIDNGTCFCWASHFLTSKQAHRFLISPHHDSMGSSVAAIGCKCAKPEYPVVAMIGDGSMRMNGMEIATAVNNHLPVIFIVLNNSEWGMVNFGHKLLGLDADVTSFARKIDFVKIAEGLGARGIKITEPGQINKELAQNLIESKETVVLDVHIDVTECPPFGSRIQTLKGQQALLSLSSVKK